MTEFERLELLDDWYCCVGPVKSGLNLSMMMILVLKNVGFAINVSVNLMHQNTMRYGDEILS